MVLTTSLVLSSLVFLVSLAAGSFAQILGLSEGSACPNGGTCRRLSSCPQSGDVRITRPLICSFDQGDYSYPIICCPQDTKIMSPAVDMCRRFDRMACSAVAVARFKRDAVSEEEAEIEDEEVAPRFLFGSRGILTNLLKPDGRQNILPELEKVKTTSRPTTHRTTKPMTTTSKSIEPVSESSAFLTPNQTVDWDSLPMEPKVIGGTEALPRELPYMALVGYGENSNGIDWACGGTIISKRFVLTAAHCVRSYQGIARWVRVGELNLAQNTEDARPRDYSVVQRYVHPNYKDPAVYNDIALLRTSRDIEFDSWVQPICLHAQPDVQEPRAVAAGWGRTDFAGPTSDSLRKVDLTMYDGSECRRLLGRAGRFMPNGVDPEIMVCAGHRQGGKDTCAGDSGGPLIVSGEAICIRTQIGIVSFGRHCGLPNMPAVYTRVAYFVPWIESIVWPRVQTRTDLLDDNDNTTETNPTTESNNRSESKE